MADSLLAGEMAGALTDALIGAGVPFDITIARSANVPDEATPWTPGEPVLTAYDALGWEENYLAKDIDGTLIEATDLRVVVLLATIAKAEGAPDASPATIVPETGDEVTSRGSSYRVVNATVDPTGAIARLQVRA
jgi:hypothetical protein